MPSVQDTEFMRHLTYASDWTGGTSSTAQTIHGVRAEHDEVTVTSEAGPCMGQ